MKKTVWITAICVLAVMLFAACSNSADENTAVYDESETVSSSVGDVSSDETATESTELSADTDEQSSAAARSSTSNTQNTTVNQKTTSSNTASTVSQQSQTTKRQTTTKSQTTTTTTQRHTTTTTQKSGLSQSDVEWVQAQAHTYMRSKGITVDSSVGSFSGRISSVNRTKEELLDEVKEWIDDEYDECKASGYDTVYMYCKIESRSNGSYFLYVMYG